MLEPDPDELDSSPESSELLLLVALSLEDLDSIGDPAVPDEPNQGAQKGAHIMHTSSLMNTNLSLTHPHTLTQCSKPQQYSTNHHYSPFLTFCFPLLLSLPLTSCNLFSSSAFFLAASSAGLVDFCTTQKATHTMVTPLQMTTI